MRLSQTNLRASAAAAIAALAITGCGHDRPSSASSREVHTVQVVRATFPARQHLAEQVAFVLTIRNAGAATIPDLAVTLSGLSQRTPDGTVRPLWVLDEPPPGTVTAIDDTWASGPLAPGRQATLRWRVTAALPGTHELRYAIASSIPDGPGAVLPGGRPARAALTVRVADRAPDARVDPRTGRVIRELSAQIG